MIKPTYLILELSIHESHSKCCGSRKAPAMHHEDVLVA